MHIPIHKWNPSGRTSLGPLLLGDDEVQVWTAVVPNEESQLMELIRFLDQDEQDRAGRFRAREPWREFVLGRAMLRQLLGACLQVDPTLLTFGYELRGKPFLDLPGRGDQLCFNLSHSGGMVALALARGRRVGIDLEACASLDDWRSIADRHFSLSERRWLESLSAEQQREAFFQVWTLKEAYLKATGEGLSDDLAAVQVLGNATPGLKALDRSLVLLNKRKWILQLLALPSGFAGAVVVEVERS